MRSDLVFILFFLLNSHSVQFSMAFQLMVLMTAMIVYLVHQLLAGKNHVGWLSRDGFRLGQKFPPIQVSWRKFHPTHINR